MRCVEFLRRSRLAARLAALRENAGSSQRLFARNLSSMALAQIAIRGTRLLTVIVLTRMLSPADYGGAAVVMTTYELILPMIRNGLDAAVVRAAPERVEALANAAYWLFWLICAGLALLHLAVSVPVALSFGNLHLALPIALMGLIHLIMPLCNMQVAMLQRDSRVGRMARASAIQLVTENGLSAAFAVAGFGLWSIVLPKLIVAPMWVIMIRSAHAWRPQGGLHREYWPELLRFSRHIVGLEFLTTIQGNIDNVLVGYFLGVEALGIYYFAFNAGIGIILGLLNSFAIAVYPHLCAVLGDRVQLAKRFRQTLKLLGVIVVPMVLVQAALAPVYVPIVFGERWRVGIPVLMLVCLSALARPFGYVTSQLLRAVGRPDVELRWQAAATAVLIAGLLVGVQFNVIAVAAAVLITQTFMQSLYSLRAPRPFIGPVLRGE